jgi:2-polyprenyl-6-methoxyphenol hydroxylase-like FAD-dependent oxidoreductase
MIDVAVVGGGPAGLAVAIEAAQKGLSVVVLERRREPLDKACGEGIMPPGVRALERLGVRARLSPTDCAPFHGVRYVDEDGLSAEGRLAGSGLAVRRVALTQAMSDRAREVGADIRYGCKVESHRRYPGEMRITTDQGELRARMLVAADGLSSPLRRAAGLEGPSSGSRRFGVRRHFQCAPWTSLVEVHLAPGAEAYVTPTSDNSVGVAFLWTEPSVLALPRAHESPASWPTRWERLTELFPELMDRLAGAKPSSAVRGAGPFEQTARARVADRLALVGDAAGYIDAITGEGISLSLLCARSLVQNLPGALAKGAHRRALLPYERDFRDLFRRYEVATRCLLAVIKRPRLRRSLLHLLRKAPFLFDAMVARACG